MGEGCLERLKEKKDELEEDLDAVFKAAWDEVAESEEEGVEEEEVEEGVDDEGACSRDILGSCSVAVVDFEICSSSPACSPSDSFSESTPSISLSSSAFGASPGTPDPFPSCSAAFSAVGLTSDWYSLHESCTC